MQGIGGPAFVAELHTRLPNVPVLVLGSGGEGANDYAGGLVRFLAMPFTHEEMIRAAGLLFAQHELKPA